MRDDLKKLLKNPPAAYRAVPFWSWNDELEPEELRRQIREMKKAGLGGYFMHARGGIKTPYMGEKWMECIEASIDEGKKQGMGAWCYDEEGWPSGFGGGAVTELGDEYHVRWLELTKQEPDQPRLESTERTLGFYIISGDSAPEYVKPVDWDKTQPPEGADIYRIAHRSNPGYIDILNKKVVHAFLQSTHEKYYKAFAADFNGAMPGFFTDEPQHSRAGIPWSYIMPESFGGKYGFDPVPGLIALYRDVPGSAEFRWKYFCLVSEMFTEAFMKQIYEWCEAHGCELTGHLMEEESLYAQVRATGGVMPSYEFMHRPGIDWLCRRIASPLVARQVGSVAAQLGKKFVLSEMFALCGWDVSFEELKWIAEWQYVNGINWMCQHLESYSIKGLRKRDYPPSFFYQMTWWDEYHRFNEYFARLGMLLTEGRSGAKVLVIHPMRSAWVLYDASANDRIRKLDVDLVAIMKMLSAAHIEYHFGDEGIMARHGSVDGRNISVGLCTYDTVVLPAMPDISRTTLRLLERFAAGGGTIIALGELPTTVEGRSDPEALAKLSAAAKLLPEISVASYLELFGSIHTPKISISDYTGAPVELVHVHERVTGEGSYFFLANIDNTAGYTAQIKVNGARGITVLSLDDLEEVTFAGDTVNLGFEPMQSRMIFAHNTAPAGLTKPVQVEAEYLRLPEEWKVSKMGMNSLTLDTCEWSADGGEWHEPMPILAIFEALLSMRKKVDFSLRFTFESEMDPSECNNLFLVAETPEIFKMTLNGQPVTRDESGTWKDISFKKLDIRPLLKRGTNEFIVSGEFFQQQHVYDVIFGKDVLETVSNRLTYDTELESFYLLGDFLVFSRTGYAEGDRKALTTDGPFVIKPMPAEMTLRSGDVTQQGLCFFAETLTLAHTERIGLKAGCRYFYKMKKPFAPMAKLFVNGQPVKVMMWAPYEADITDFLRDGDNVIELELFAGNRNLLGPHHHAQGELYAVSPQSFRERPFIMPDGQVNPKYQRNYCFVKFGVDL